MSIYNGGRCCQDVREHLSKERWEVPLVGYVEEILCEHEYLSTPNYVYCKHCGKTKKVAELDGRD